MLLDQLVLVLAACALGGAALRAASRIVANGARPSTGASVAEKVLVAAPLGAAFAVCWTLIVGLVGLAGSPLALAAGPLAAWVAVRALLPTRHPALAASLAERWDGASPAQRAGALALAGALTGCIVEIARQPGFDVDALAYHLPDVTGWIHSGHVGSVQTFSYDFPVGYYPVTGEVLLTWVLGISHSFAPLAIWSPAALLLALLGLWRLLAVLEVPPAVASFSIAAFGTLPILAVGLNLNGPGTDLPAVAWLACVAALSARARERPALLGPALVAAGLAVGTKTTVAPLAVAALLVGGWRARAGIRAARGSLLTGACAGLLVCAPWYVRNTVAHGWPLWPFSSGPTGDPLTHAMSLFDASFFERPVATVRALGAHNYLTWLAGGLGLIAGAIAVPILVRSRAALLASAMAIAALLAWGAAPFTGAARNPLLALLTLSTLRYMLAALGACAVALAIAARDGSHSRRTAIVALLVVSTAGSVISDARLRYPDVPTLSYVLAGAAVGALIGVVFPRRLPDALPGAAGALAAALALVFLALSGPNWLWRESERPTYNAAVLSFMLRQPGFASGSQPIAFAPSVVATLAGPRLQHPISLIGAQEPCARVRSRLRRGWVVVFPKLFAAGITTPFDAALCLRRQRPLYDDGNAVVYGPAA